MKHIYANLLGEWVNLSDDENCVMGSNRARPFVWWEETLKYGVLINVMKNIPCIS